MGLPKMTAKIRIVLVFTATLIGILVWLAAIILAPYLRSLSSPLAGVIYTAFSPVCHQIPSRCFVLFGHPLAVCSRCLGIYAGFLGGTLLYPFVRGVVTVRLPKLKTFILLTLPIASDTAGNVLSLWRTSDWGRFLVGFLWGSLLPFYFITGIADALKYSLNSRSVKNRI